MPPERRRRHTTHVLGPSHRGCPWQRHARMIRNGDVGRAPLSAASPFSLCMQTRYKCLRHKQEHAEMKVSRRGHERAPHLSPWDIRGPQHPAAHKASAGVAARPSETDRRPLIWGAPVHTSRRPEFASFWRARATAMSAHATEHARDGDASTAPANGCTRSGVRRGVGTRCLCGARGRWSTRAHGGAPRLLWGRETSWGCICHPGAGHFRAPVFAVDVAAGVASLDTRARPRR